MILATDCDREGQLIGQEILEHLRYRGTVQRALFTAQDPKSLRQAFDKLKPNRELRPLYEAAVARQQADQIFNLSLTRTATRTLHKGGCSCLGANRTLEPGKDSLHPEFQLMTFGPNGTTARGIIICQGGAI